MLKSIINKWYNAIFRSKKISERKTDEDLQKIKSRYGIKELPYETYKNNSKYSYQNGLTKGNNNFLLNNLRVTKIEPNVFYENISFYNVTFTNFMLKNVCFHNCSFTFCNFINITTATYEDVVLFNNTSSCFSCCKFLYCKFEKCNLEELHFSIVNLKSVIFIDTYFNNVIFNMNSFNNVMFENNCKLNNFYIFSPSGMLDIQFSEDKGAIFIDKKSRIGQFKYKDKINIYDRKNYKIYKKQHYKNIAATYYALEQLSLNNKLLDQKNFYFYQRKKAETRSKCFRKAIFGYLSELCFGYGEYPSRAILSILTIILIYAPFYMLSGFNTGSRFINYTLNGDFSISQQKIKDFIESVYFSYITLITVGQGSAEPVSILTKVLSASERKRKTVRRLERLF